MPYRIAEILQRFAASIFVVTNLLYPEQETVVSDCKQREMSVYVCKQRELSVYVCKQRELSVYVCKQRELSL